MNVTVTISSVQVDIGGVNLKTVTRPTGLRMAMATRKMLVLWIEGDDEHLLCWLWGKETPIKCDLCPGLSVCAFANEYSVYVWQTIQGLSCHLFEFTLTESGASVRGVGEIDGTIVSARWPITLTETHEYVVSRGNLVRFNRSPSAISTDGLSVRR